MFYPSIFYFTMLLIYFLLFYGSKPFVIFIQLYFILFSIFIIKYDLTVFFFNVSDYDHTFFNDYNYSSRTCHFYTKNIHSYSKNIKLEVNLDNLIEGEEKTKEYNENTDFNTILIATLAIIYIFILD